MADQPKPGAPVPSTEAGTAVYEGSHGDYEIHATPEFKTVTPGAQVTYYCNEKTSKIFANGAPKDSMRWYCILDQATVKWYTMGPVIPGPFGSRWENHEWHKMGRHTIQCCIRKPDGTKFILEYPQWVDSVESVLGDFARGKKDAELPCPEKELSVVTRKIPALKSAKNKLPIKDPNAGIPYDLLKYMDKTGRKPVGPPPKTKQELHDHGVKELEKYRDKLAEQLSTTEGKKRLPIRAAHLAIESQQRTHLRVFVAEVSAADGEHTWHLVDWTNPVERRLTGVYEGKGKTAEEAIRDAIGVWEEDNRYFDGRIQYEVPSNICGKAITGSFETDGASFWDSVATFFEMLAMGAAILAGIITLVAPVPGSQVVSAMIWTSIFSSTAAAVINIGQRYHEGFSNWGEDALDLLTVAANVFGAAWMRCANVTGKAISPAAKEFVLYGQVGVDGVEGILIAAQQYQDFENLMNDDTLMPEQRFDKMLGFLRQLAVQGLMKYVSVKGTTDDIANVRAGKSNPPTIEQLKSPGQKVDLDEVPKAEVHVTKENDTGVVHIQGEHPRVQTEPVLPKAEFRPPIPPVRRGMRKRDHKSFKKLAQDEGKIIIVRDSNPIALEHMGKEDCLPKPVDVKGKTRKTPPNVGLAAYGPEDHAAEMAALPPEKRFSYEEYKKKLDAKGYTLGGPEEGFVVKDKAGNKFYSDYDLHGVYDAKTGKDAYSQEFRDKFNALSGKKMIQHGAHDNWPDRQNFDEARVNYGPQPACTAYMPDGSAVRLETVAEMHKFYKANNLDWEGLYGQIDWDKYLKFHPKAVLGELHPK